MATITNINELDLNGTYSYADYLLWKFEERIELIKGKIFKMSPAPSRKHQDVSRNLNRILDRYFYKQKCRLYYALFDVRLPSKDKKGNDIETLVQPDLCVVCDPEKLDEKGCIGAPDLIIEILSPGNSKREMKQKFQIYEEAGVREYWIVHPTEKNILLYVIENEKYVYKNAYFDDDEMTSVIFPELKINVGELFEE